MLVEGAIWARLVSPPRKVDIVPPVTPPTVAKPCKADYQDCSDTPRSLHAWQPDKLSRLSQKRRDALERSASRGENGRALLGAKSAKKTKLQTMLQPTTPHRLGAAAWVWAIIDSGCSWHVHHRIEDCINLRPCHDKITGIDGKVHRATAIGDLPAVANGGGKWHKILIRNVRVVPSMNDTLFSVDQFWEDSKTDTVFRNMRCLVLPPSSAHPKLCLPFERRDKLYQWRILPTARLGHSDLHSSTVHALKAATIHAPTVSSHVASLPPDRIIDVLHRRLHIGFDVLRKMGDMARDVPGSIAQGKAHSCEHCKEANAARLPHTGSGYTPSYPGRLVHADIAGPFKRSQHGQHQYFLILIDDHTRWKQVYFLRRKSEAIHKIRNFVTKLNAITNRGKAEPTKIVGSLHTDNAGEFLSHEFEEMLDDEMVHHTTCPPHVHQLNGVAERAIRSVLENVRANMAASHAPLGFWPYLVEHAVDCLNRTTGPPGSSKTAFEMLTGEKPKVMAIMPFGCSAFAVKPRAAFSKSTLEARAWVGINLGREPGTPGAYNIWIPSLSKTV